MAQSFAPIAKTSLFPSVSLLQTGSKSLTYSSATSTTCVLLQNGQHPAALSTPRLLCHTKKMNLSFQNKSFWESLHLKNGLEDWDMAEELKLTITTEEIRQEPGVQPHLWTWVNPSLVCPIPGSPGVDPAGSNSPAASAAGAAETSSPNTSWDYSDPDCSEDDVPSSSSEAGKFLRRCRNSWTQGDADALEIRSPQTSEREAQVPQAAEHQNRGRLAPSPLNYCILITLALCNSASGSLTVRQIYQFAQYPLFSRPLVQNEGKRDNEGQHFPFFQTAPEDWKNTIRHNLCFSSCFEKAAGFVCGEGNRKSCLWKLTPEGHRKLQEEAQALPEEALDLVRQSTSEPDLMGSLFGL
ncbi:forkhead box protein R1 [Gymnogyps californianus]|uniref:forkhead box protein R1 n=1 Tax=Gymnogyps californianus TaxID=33616 RepID=UPI0021C5E09E|nr:forkhead box protein R1 [Gymnogyps californianus]